MKRKHLGIAGAVVLLAAVAGGVLFYLFPGELIQLSGLGINYVRSMSQPPGTLATETNPAFKGSTAAATAAPAAPTVASDDWPSYNRTLNSDRFSPLSQIDTTNAARLKVICTYEVGEFSTIETGLIMVQNALIGTTANDIFSLDPATCTENWRAHEDSPTALLPSNRGAAYADGLLFRGTQDGRVMAYDFTTGKRVWATTISDPRRGEAVPSAPIAAGGLVFIGNAGGDFKGGKGKMFALDAKTGKIVWQFFLVPKEAGDVVRGPLGATPLDTSTWRNDNPGIPISGGGTWTSYTLDAKAGLLYVPVGNPAPDFVPNVRGGDNLFTNSVVVLDAKTGDYRKHFQLVPADWHDWDVSNTPAIVQTHGGRKLMTLAPKDGHLYGFDLATNQRLYRVPVTRIENVDAKFSFEEDTYFCPGAAGGGEWNGPAYDPRTNLLLVGQIEWCSTVRMRKEGFLEKVPVGLPWPGMATFNPLNIFGVFGLIENWAGWVYGVDADTGVWKWRVKTNYPVMAAVTPTAGGVAFFGDIGGNFYALDAASGQKLWGQNLGGALAGGVITYTTASGTQRVAVAAGFTIVAVPTKIVHAKIVVLGLDGPSGKP